MAIFYPRKQTVIIFVVCMIAVLGAAYYNSSVSQTSAATAPEADSGQPISVSADTATGTPAIAASSDWKDQFISTSSADGSAGGSPSGQPLTLTDQFGRNIFMQYMQLEQSGLSNDTDTVDQAASAIVDNGLSAQQPWTYTAKDIRTIPADDNASLARWASVAAADLDLYTASESEATIAQAYVSQDDASVLSGIDPIVSDYKKMLSSLTAVPTPSYISSDSLDLVNSLSSLEFAAQSFRAIDTDPMKGMLGLSAYSNGVQQLMAALKETSDALQARGIIFNINPTMLNVLLGNPQQP